MIISKTPFRLSFFGGGTDYPQWYQKEGGAVLSTTIDKYCYISARLLPPFFDFKHRIVWSHIETVSMTREILHPAVRETLRHMNCGDENGYEIHHQGDLPARTGIGSSSSFVVGLVNAISALNDKNPTKKELADMALDIEQNVLRENVGSQDQVAAAYGGLNVIRFSDKGYKVEPLKVNGDRVADLESRLLMVYTGSSRTGTFVAQKIVENMDSKGEYLRKMHGMVDKGADILSGNKSLDEFGRLLNETWNLKKKLSSAMTSPTIEATYAKAMGAGALGGKLLGAGAAGFMVFYVPPRALSAVREALAHYLCVPFKFENQGSVIIHKSNHTLAVSPAAEMVPARRLKLTGS